MTMRLIEECLELENMEEEKYSRWIKILVPKDVIAIIFDPYIINIQDLINVRPGRVSLVRVRRPGWGKGDLHKYIHVLK